MATLKQMLQEIESSTPRAPAEVLAETPAEMENIDYPLPPLTPGARAYLAQHDGHGPRLTLEAQKVAAEYGSVKTHRLHAVMAAQAMGLYKGGNGNGQKTRY